MLTLALEAGSGYGGAEKLAYEFALRLDPARFKSYLCTIRDRPDRREAIERDRAELASRRRRVHRAGRELGVSVAAGAVAAALRNAAP